MRNLKRALSLTLASVMLLGMMVVGSSAMSFNDADQISNVTAATVLEELEVMVGDGSNFNPSNVVTRGEMAVIVCKILYGDKLNVSQFVDGSKFTDVPTSHYSNGYVNLANQLGIISGYGNGKFGPDDTVTTAQAAVMLCKALGYFKGSEMTGDWSNDALTAVTQATTLNLFEGLRLATHEGLVRDNVAAMTFNTITRAIPVEYNERFDAYYAAGSAWTNGVPNLPAEDVGDKNDGVYQLTLAHKNFKLNLVESGVSPDDLGRPSSIWKHDNEDIVKVANAADYTYVIDKDRTGDTLQATLRDLTGNKSMTADAGVTYVLNGDTDTAANIQGAASYGTIVEVYLDADDSDKYETVVAYNYTLDKIEDVDDDVKDADAKNGVSYYVDFKNAGAKINNTDIAGFNSATYEKDAYVALIQNNDGEIIASYIPEVVNGAITTVKGTEYITAGSRRYLGVNYTSNSAEYIAPASIDTSSDGEYDVYLDQNGYVLGVKEIEGSAAKLDDVYYLDTVWKTTGGVGGRVATYYAQVVSLADGTVRSEVVLETKDHSLGANSADLSTYGTNFDALKGLLVTVTDKKETDSSANNDKFNLKVWSNAVNSDFDVYTSVGFAVDSEIKAGDSRLNATSSSLNGAGSTSKTFRLNSATQYVFLKSSANDLGVSTYTGGVSYVFSSENLGTGAGKAMVITESGSAVAQYVIIPCAKSDTKGTFSEDAIFIKDASSDKGSGYRLQSVYTASGAKEDEWKIDESEYPGTFPGFFNYSENDDGYMELDAAEALTFTPNAYWDDQEGAINNATITKGDLYTDSASGDVYLSVTVNGNKLNDIKVTDAKFVDAHDTGSEYDRAIRSLSALYDLVKAGADGKAGVKNVVLYLNVSKDGAQTIVLTSAPAKGEGPLVPPTNTEVPADADAAAVNKALTDSTESATVPAEANITGEVSVPADKALIVKGNAQLANVKLAAGSELKVEGATAQVTIQGGIPADATVEAAKGAVITIEGEQKAPVVVTGIAANTALDATLKAAVAAMLPNGGQVDMGSNITNSNVYNPAWGMVNLVIPTGNKNLVIDIYKEDGTTLVARTGDSAAKQDDVRFVGLTTKPLDAGCFEYVNEAASATTGSAGAHVLNAGTYKYVVKNATVSGCTSESAGTVTGDTVVVSGYFTVA